MTRRQRMRRGAGSRSAALLATAALAVLLLAAACTTGGSIDELASARSPHGAEATLIFRSGGQQRVELLTANDTTLLVLHQDSVKRVEFDRLSRVRVHGFASYRRPINDLDRGKIARVSRFPYGVTPEILRALLAEAGQTEPGRFE